MIEKLPIEPFISEIVLKTNELIDEVNELNRRERNRNRATHKNVIKVGEGELAYCNDCHGREVELYDATCGQRQGLETS